jgi:hypothetical protein
MPEENDWTPEAQWLKDKGLVSGFSDGTFRPGVYVTRGQLAVALKRMYEMVEKEFTKKA